MAPALIIEHIVILNIAAFVGLEFHNLCIPRLNFVITGSWNKTPFSFGDC